MSTETAVTIAYCTTCSWQVHADDESIVNLNRAMIDHHVETGHPVERADAPEALERVEREPSTGCLECE